tara:strand:+ start:2032 stop:2250 length:219 start_codon:yes stop_codon:yes gene_type:complete
MKLNYIIICNNTSDIFVRCNKEDLADILLMLNKSKDIDVIDFFEYKSEEYKMFIYGDDYIAEDKCIDNAICK